MSPEDEIGISPTGCELIAEATLITLYAGAAGASYYWRRGRTMAAEDLADLVVGNLAARSGGHRGERGLE